MIEFRKFAKYVNDLSSVTKEVLLASSIIKLIVLINTTILVLLCIIKISGDFILFSFSLFFLEMTIHLSMWFLSHYTNYINTLEHLLKHK